MPDEPNLTNLFPDLNPEGGQPGGGTGQPKEDPNKAILEAIGTIKSSVESLGTRLDDLEVRIQAVANPPEDDGGEGTQTETFQPKTWAEASIEKPREVAQETARETTEQILAEKDAQIEAKKKADADQQKQIDSYLDKQLTDLETTNKIPKVINVNDANDPGRTARRELFGLAAHVGTMDLTKVNEVAEILHKSGYSFDPLANNGQGAYLRSGTTPSGITAPVSAPGKTGGSYSPSPQYREIAGKSMDQLVREHAGE